MNKLLIILIAIIMASCGSDSENQKAVPRNSAKNGELPSLAYTVYSEKTELFAEFRTPVVGDTLKLAGHFTHLGEFFTVINEGTVTLSLSVGNNITSQTSTISSSPGIFRYAILPQKTGVGKLIFDIINKEYTDQIIIDNITVYADAKIAVSSAKEEHKGNEITFLKEQAWKVEFANMAVTPRPFSEVIKTIGEIIPAQGDEMLVTANTAGIITFNNNNVIVGTSVNTGEMLFTISGGNLTYGNTETLYKQAKVAYEKSKADYERTQELVKDNIVSQKDFQDSKAKYETEQANYNNLARNYQAGGQKVVSPLSGFVKNIFVNEGQYVSVGQPLATVSQNRRLVVKAEVSQKYFSKLGSITSANFKLTYDKKAYSIESLNGRLLSYGKSNDINTLFIPVTFSFDNKGNFISGSLVDVYLKLKPFDGAIVIPVSSLIEEQGLFFVYVQTSGESFEKRELTLGGSDGINVHVLAGLKVGERVVTRGAYQIKLAAASGVIPAHGHAH